MALAIHGNINPEMFAIANRKNVSVHGIDRFMGLDEKKYLK